MSALLDLRALVETQLSQPLPPRLSPFLAAVLKRWPDAVAVLFYGSARRESGNPEKEPDFYILFERNRDSGQSAPAALANAALPPNVRFLQIEEGFAKCALMTVSAFEREASRGFASVIWGRFAQPSTLVYAANEDIRDRIAGACTMCVERFLRNAAPLTEPGDDAETLWVTGLMASYGSELRAESANRPAELFDADSAYYRMAAQHFLDANPDARQGRASAAWRWAARRIWGKARTMMHVIKAAFTVGEGGLDYVLSKLSRHSGVEIEPTAWQRAHPRLAAPGLAWRLWRKGAFR